MRVDVISRDREVTTHQAPKVAVDFDEDRVVVTEIDHGPNGERYLRTTYLRESIARIVEPDYIPE